MRHGIVLKRTTLAEWMGRIGLALQPLFDAVRTQLLAAPVLHADETPVAQLDPGAGKTKRAYLFVYRNTDAHPIILFDYGPTCAGKHAAAFLGSWNGALMVDDYAGYKALFANGVTELGCGRTRGGSSSTPMPPAVARSPWKRSSASARSTLSILRCAT